MLNFEDIYKDITDCVDISIYKFRTRLKTDKEDLKQELLINIFNNLDAIEKAQEKGGNWQGYVYGMCYHKLQQVELEEHKQGLWVVGTYDEAYMTETSYLLNINDPYLEKYYEKQRQKAKKYREENPDKVKEYAKQYNKKYYQENKERIKEKSRLWDIANKDRVKENRKIWEDKNKEHLKEYRKQYNEEHKEHLKEYHKQWFQEHKEEQKEKRKEYIKEYSKQYYQKNKEKIKEYQRQRKKQLKELERS